MLSVGATMKPVLLCIATDLHQCHLSSEDSRALFQRLEDSFEADKEKKRNRTKLDEVTDASVTEGWVDGLKQVSIDTAFLPQPQKKEEPA